MSSTDLARTPAASAPPGYVSNLDDPVTKSTSAGVVLAIVGMVIATGFLIIRIYTKAVLARIFGIDDIFLIVAWVLVVGVQISIVWGMVSKIIGVHVWDLSVVGLQKLSVTTAVDSVLYLAVMALVKFSILHFYLRLSREKWFTYTIYATIAFVFSFSVALMLSLIFACTPLKRVWDVTITEGHCINQGKIYLATAGLNVASDVIILILPIPMLQKLQIRTRQKVGLMIIFSIGSLTMVTSIIRLTLMPPMIKNLDASWAIRTPAIWICIEGNLAIICGCLPILRLFIRHVAPSLLGEYRSTGASGRSGPHRPSGRQGSELSNMERTKRSMRSYSRMHEESCLDTMGGMDDGSETNMVPIDTKAIVRTDTFEIGSEPRKGYSMEDLSAATPYSQLEKGHVRLGSSTTTAEHIDSLHKSI